MEKLPDNLKKEFDSIRFKYYPSGQPENYLKAEQEKDILSLLSHAYEQGRKDGEESQRMSNEINNARVF